MKDSNIPYNPAIDPVNIPTFEKPNIEDFNEKEFKKSDAYKKYVKPLIDAEKSQKKSKRASWWKANWISIVTLIVAVLKLIATIIFGLR